MKAVAKTDVGKKRSMNQDFFYCNENNVGSFHNLLIVADGMGGHKAGDQASKLCVKSIVETIEQSNKSIYDAARENIAFEGMGTTMVACTLVDGKMYVANIGDSRLYLIRESIHQITDDHSLVEELVKQGNLTESEARVHPQKNIITRALGIDQEVRADYFEIEMHKDDIILLCSDGLSNMIEDDDMEYIIKNSATLEEAGDKLIESANRNGGDDNITAVLAKIE